MLLRDRHQGARAHIGRRVSALNGGEFLGKVTAIFIHLSNVTPINKDIVGPSTTCTLFFICSLISVQVLAKGWSARSRPKIAVQACCQFLRSQQTHLRSREERLTSVACKSEAHVPLLAVFFVSLGRVGPTKLADGVSTRRR